MGKAKGKAKGKGQKANSKRQKADTYLRIQKKALLPHPTFAFCYLPFDVVKTVSPRQ